MYVLFLSFKFDLVLVEFAALLYTGVKKLSLLQFAQYIFLQKYGDCKFCISMIITLVSLI